MPRLVQDWQPENPEFWQNGGRKTARRNLWISVPVLMLAFTAWQVWSVVVIHPPCTGLNYLPNQLFWLAAVPALSGVTFRAFCSLMVPVFNSRRWTAFSTASLLLPAAGLGMIIQSPDTSYGIMLPLALSCGLGGANFSSSMANISFFFLKAEKGTVMGLNAGLGNLDVSVAQPAVPLVTTTGLFGALDDGAQIQTEGSASKQIRLQNAGFVRVPFIIASSLAARFDINDLASTKTGFTEQAVIFKHKHNWATCFIYPGALGSFLGFSVDFPLLIQVVFPTVNPVEYTFFGPLIDVLTWPFDDQTTDKTGSGAKATQWVFISMIAAMFNILSFLPSETQSGSFWGSFTCFMTLFALSGIDDGSAFMQIPITFLTPYQRRVERGLSDGKRALTDTAKEGTAVAGFTGTFAAYGDFFIPKSYSMSITFTDSVNDTLYGFILFYPCCLLLNWWHCARRNTEVRR